MYKFFTIIFFCLSILVLKAEWIYVYHEGNFLFYLRDQNPFDLKNDTICLGETIDIEYIVDSLGYKEFISSQTTFENATPSSSNSLNPTNIKFTSPGLQKIGVFITFSDGIIITTYYIFVNYCPPSSYFSIDKDTICNYECITISDSSSNYPTYYTYIISNNNSVITIDSNINYYCFNDTGFYTIKQIVSNPAGVDSSIKTIYVKQSPQPIPVDLYQVYNYGDTIKIDACATGDYYTWGIGNNLITNNNDNDSLITILPVELVTYLHLNVSNNNFCKIGCDYTIITNGVPEDILIPTAFSPNNDGINDAFGILNIAQFRTLKSFSIYNRYGEKVFYTNEQKQKWDGTYKNRKQPMGTYIFYIYLMNELTKEETIFKGNVTLIE